MKIPVVCAALALMSISNISFAHDVDVDLDAITYADQLSSFVALVSYVCVNGKPKLPSFQSNATFGLFLNQSEMPPVFDSFGESLVDAEGFKTQHLEITNQRYLWLRENIQDSSPLLLGAVGLSEDATEHCSHDGKSGYHEFKIVSRGQEPIVSGRLLKKVKCIYNPGTGVYSRSAKLQIKITDSLGMNAKQFTTTAGAEFAAKDKCQKWRAPFEDAKIR